MLVSTCLLTPSSDASVKRSKALRVESAGLGSGSYSGARFDFGRACGFRDSLTWEVRLFW